MDQIQLAIASAIENGRTEALYLPEHQIPFGIKAAVATLESAIASLSLAKVLCAAFFVLGFMQELSEQSEPRTFH